MASKTVVNYSYFYALCNQWREEYQSQDLKFRKFLELLEITEDEFVCEIHDPKYLDEMRSILLIRISDMTGSHDWIGLIELWDELRLGAKINEWCALAVESTIHEGRPSVAAKIVASHKNLSQDLTNYALTEYARDCEERGSTSEFQLFCRRTGILPTGPTPMF